MVIELQDCHHGLTAFAAMTSVRNDGLSDVSSAYQRAIAREENAVIPEQRTGAVEPGARQATSEPEADGDSDLYRHHSQQQSLEGA
jgi:hypothetical protein